MKFIGEYFEVDFKKWLFLQSFFKIDHWMRLYDIRN